MGASISNGGGGRGRNRRGRAFTDINITPFVDVMLVLLIIFMVTAPMLTTGVPVDLPDTKAKALPGNDEPLSVSVTKDGTIYIQDTKTDLANLGQKLASIAGEKKDTRIFVRGDRSVDYGQVMKTVAEISGAGYSKVALVTEIGGSPKN
jgi:biopolymer transport protein TolR